MDASQLLDMARTGVARAQALGADQTEVFASAQRTASVELQKDDIHNASTENETTFGVRVFRHHSQGFATVNSPERLPQACEEALAMAAVTPPDELNGLAEPRGVVDLDEPQDAAIVALDVGQLVELASGLLAGVKGTDERIRVDSGGVSAEVSARAIATSTGIELRDEHAFASGSLFGMATDRNEVGSFDHDGHTTRRFADIVPELNALVSRFCVKTLGALGARRGESFRGTVVLTPEVVHSLVLENLLAALSGRAKRTGKSHLKDSLGQSVAADLLSLKDDARRPWACASSAFDREGTPTSCHSILEQGVLTGFLYDVYEGRADGLESTGHARGGATSQPAIGVSNLVLAAGETTLSRLCTEQPRCIVVTRFSGSTNAITGDFSGVVKGGFLIRNGDRMPVKETLISGNLYDLLQSVSGVSRETRHLNGSACIPALRVEDISITAG